MLDRLRGRSFRAARLPERVASLVEFADRVPTMTCWNFVAEMTKPGH
jgi:hypothetical protein